MKPELKYLKLAVAFAFVLGVMAVENPRAQAQTLAVVHDFTGGSDGGYSVNGLIMNPGGALFGTASSGGTSNNGVVFKITTAGAEIVLHSFAGGSDGAAPNAGVIRSKSGIFYGTTTAGGTYGKGIVFQLIGSKETVLYSFAGGTDGATPEANLALDAAGNLYGTTSAGGAKGNGTVFKLAAPKAGKWTESVLYSFGAGTDGATPVGGVSLDASGNLYGTTSAGGTYGLGTVFKLTPGIVWTETILHNFQNGDDGAVPYADLIADTLGNFYGAATEGGANGGGTVFKLTPSNGSWNFSVLYSVPGWGISGSFGNVILDTTGKIYGTTHCDGAYNAGTIYELTPSGGTWSYTQLYNFTGGNDGQYSFGNLVVKQGKLYGTTKYAGTHGEGTIFALTP